jgi:hypothetical protein
LILNKDLTSPNHSSRHQSESKSSTWAKCSRKTNLSFHKVGRTIISLTHWCLTNHPPRPILLLILFRLRPMFIAHISSFCSASGLHRCGYCNGGWAGTLDNWLDSHVSGVGIPILFMHCICAGIYLSILLESSGFEPASSYFMIK